MTPSATRSIISLFICSPPDTPLGFGRGYFSSTSKFAPPLDKQAGACYNKPNMSSTVEHIRQEIDQLAPDEVRELFTDLQQEYPLRLLQVEETAPDLSDLSEVDKIKLEALRRDIQEAADSLDRGEGIQIDWNAKLARRHQEYAARQAAR